MKSFAMTCGIALAVLLALDFAWLTLTSSALYKPNMPGLMRSDPNMVAAGAFYLLYSFGLTFLVLQPVLYGPGPLKLMDLAVRAGVFGLVAYATYDLTALAVIPNWSLKLSLIDMAWGAVVTSATALVTAFLLRVLGHTNGT